MNYPDDEVRQILELLQARIPEVLGVNLEGIYVKGSLALGDFNLQTSDVDLLVIVKTKVNEAEFAALDAMHRAIQALPNRYRHDLELAYIPLSFVNGFEHGQYHASLERGERLKWKLLGSNWILDFWIVREHGWVLFGPDPKTLIDPIPPQQLRQAVREVVPLWLEWAATPDDPGWQQWMGTLRFAVETMCRVLYVLRVGEMCSKPVAVRWALQNLPDKWPSLIQASQDWGLQPVDKSWLLQVWGFIEWVGAESTKLRS